MKTLHRKIRYAEEENNPSLFSYLLENELNEGINNKVKQRELSLAQFQLLLETMKDQGIPSHWRQQCLDHIYKPLFVLQKMADNEHERLQVKELFYQLKIIGHSLQENLYSY